jgi:tetratricopeptide (TPR) repeat protein
MQTLINLKAVLILGVSLPVLGVGVHLLHGYQVRRNARFLLEQAGEAEQAGKPKEAAAYLKQYLGMTPLDAKAAARFALLRYGVAVTPRQKLDAYFNLEQALRLAPDPEDVRLKADREDVRLKAVELAMELGLYKEALGNLDQLLPKNPRDWKAKHTELLHDQARCYAKLGNIELAEKRYFRATYRDPGNIRLHREFADLLRNRLKRPAEADEVMKKLVHRDERSVKARLARAQYFADYGLREQAEEDVQYAMDELKARDAEVLLLAAGLADSRGRLDEADKLLREGRKHYPRDTRFPTALARLAWQDRRSEAQDRRAKALAHLRGLLKATPAGAEELLGLADLLIDLGAIREARRVIKNLNKGNPPPVVLYLQARLCMREGAGGEARQLLDRALSGLRVAGRLTGLVHFRLAQCYGGLGNPDQQLRHYRQALDSDPRLLPARQGLAATLADLGKSNQAIAEYRRLWRYLPEAGADLARLLLRENVVRPAAERDWAELDRLLDALDRLLPAYKEDLAILRADVLVNSGRPDAARGRLETERDRDPTKIQPWLALAGLAMLQKEYAAIPPLLDRAEKAAGRQPEWLRVRAEYYVKTAGTKALPELRKLAAAVDQFPAAQRGWLLRELGKTFAAAGDVPAARRLWHRYVRGEPGELDFRFLLFEMAVQERKGAEARRLLDEIRRAAGPGALTAYGEAALLVLAARRDGKKDFTEARRLLDEAAAGRPSWSRVPFLRGWLFDLEGHYDKALEQYQLALARGDRRLLVVQRTAQLLCAQGRFADADALVRQLPEEALQVLPKLGRMGAELSLLTRPAEGQGREEAQRRALELARRAAGGSKDFHQHIWLGQIAAAAGEIVEAERAFRRARDLAKGTPAAWTPLMLFLAKHDPDRAKTELARAEKELAGKDRALALAPCYEALGRAKEAERLYRTALDARPRDSAVLYQVAAYYERVGQRDRAEPLLRTLCDPATKAPAATRAWARRLRALTLAGRGTYPEFQTALELLDANRDGDRETTEDSRARARVLATQPSHRAEAINLLRKLAQKDALAPNERLLLARLYEADGNGRLAVSQLETLLKDRPKSPVYLAQIVRSLLTQKRTEEAREYMDRLAAVRPEALETIELQARVLHAAGKRGEAVDLLRAYAERKDARKDAAAQVLEQLGAAKEAEQLYRDLAATPRRPEAKLALAGYLGRRGRAREALDVCAEAWRDCSPELVAFVCVGVLRSGRGDAVQQRRVERWLADAARRHPQSLTLPLMQADLAMYRGQSGEAVRLYGRVLERDEHNVLALNNLAFLLAVHESRPDEALRLIDRAMTLAGPTADLLDTQGSVYLSARKPDLARKALRQALAQAPSAGAYFHLAQAELVAQNRSEARRAFRKAAWLGLRADALHVSERPALAKLARDLGE